MLHKCNGNIPHYQIFFTLFFICPKVVYLHMQEHRCTNCNKLLFKGLYTGTIEVKCTKCKTLNFIRLPKSDLDKRDLQ